MHFEENLLIPQEVRNPSLISVFGIHYIGMICLESGDINFDNFSCTGKGNAENADVPQNAGFASLKLPVENFC